MRENIVRIVLCSYFPFLIRFMITKISCNDHQQPVGDKLKNLSKIFQTGSLLESFENQIEISTFHIESIEDRKKFRDPKITDTTFEASISLYQEMECLKTESTRNSLQEKCFIVSGFRVAEEDSFRYFTKNWREVCGLGNILTYLEVKYFVSSVSFLVNNSFIDKSKDFHFIIILELYYNSCDLIHLLDFVQKFRVERNVGFISIYTELKLEHKDESLPQ